MRNILFKIEYDGTNYCGWQRQKSPQSIVHCPQKKTIQEVIEETLRQILQEKIKIIVSGRTDSGVHAKAQVANFKTNSNIALDKLILSINALLPEDIAIHSAQAVPEDFHSRFCAKSKVYRYTILNSYFRGALLRNYVYSFVFPLDVKLMRAEAKCLLGRHDFKAFCASASGVKTTVRTIKKISIKHDFYTGTVAKCLNCVIARSEATKQSFIFQWVKDCFAIARNDKKTVLQQSHTLSAKRYPLIIIDIEADGFLYNMVRNIVGTLIEIGRGRFPRGSLKKILLSKNRRIAGPTAPAKGLCLLEVKYL